VLDVSTVLQNLTIVEKVPTTIFATQTRVENGLVFSTRTEILSFTTTSSIFVDAGSTVTSTTTQIRPTTYTIFKPAAFNVTGELSVLVVQPFPSTRCLMRLPNACICSFGAA
jgi:hypothetical protein